MDITAEPILKTESGVAECLNHYSSSQEDLVMRNVWKSAVLLQWVRSRPRIEAVSKGGYMPTSCNALICVSKGRGVVSQEGPIWRP